MGLIRCSLACAGLLLAIGCTRANSDYCDADRPCAGDRVCDLEGVLGNRNACVTPVCAPGEVLSCDGELAEVCTNDQLGVAVETCDFGCNDDGCAPCPPGGKSCRETAPGSSEVAVCAADGSVIDQRECVLGCLDAERCTDVDPSNDLELDLDMIDRELAEIEDLILGDGYTVHSDGTITDGADQPVPVSSFQRRPQAGGPMMTVFHARSIEITGQVLLTGPDVIAFVAIGDITIDGLLIVRAGGISDRAVDDCVGEAGASDGLDASGSGGGGYESSGGIGGDAGLVPGGSGGGSVSVTSALIPLKAGCAGGGVMGGVGGGGLQLVSRSRIVIGPEAGINAGGAGGSAPVDATVVPPGGGGAGGGVLLEAPVIDIDEAGFVGANGGGGACAAPNEVKQGADGALGTTQALGGDCLENNSGQGGAGGAKAGLREDGEDRPGSGVEDVGGGGGGSVGRIRVNSVLGAPSSSRFSPDPSLGTLDTR